MQILVTLLTIALAAVVGSVLIALQQQRRSKQSEEIQLNYRKFISEPYMGLPYLKKPTGVRMSAGNMTLRDISAGADVNLSSKSKDEQTTNVKNTNPEE